MVTVMASDPFSAVVETTNLAVDTLGRLDVLKAVKSKLVNNPDRAAAHLVEVLDIIDAVYQEMRKQILDFSTLDFSSDTETGKSRRHLRNLKTDGLATQISDADAACNKIKNIYKTHLDAWFQRVLNETEQDQLRNLFDEMSIMDFSLVGAMHGLSSTLGTASAAILSALDQSGSAAAKKLIGAIEHQLDAALKNLSGQFAGLKSLRSDFVAISNAL